MKVIEVIKKLSATERNRLKKFLESPYFNVNEDLINLFSEINNKLRNNGNIDKIILWESLYKKEAYDDVKWRKNLTTLFSLIEKFVAIDHLSSDRTSLANLTLRSAIEKDIPELMLFSAKHFEKYLETEPKSSVDTQLKYIAYLKNRQYIISDFERKQEKEKSEAHRKDLIALDRTLDLAYLQEKLRIACAYEHYSFVYNFEEKINFEQEVIKMADYFEDNLTPGVNIYQKILIAYRETSDKPFIEALFNQLKTHEQEFSRMDMKDLYVNLLNLIILKVNSGAHEYEQTLLNLFQFGLQNNLLYEQGKILPGMYRNIAFIAAKLKEYDWALEFIETNRQFLEDKYQETAYSFNKARLLTNMKRFEELVEVLRDVEYEDLTYNLNSKLLLMVAYYELEEYTVLDSFIKSFKVFLRRRRNIPKKRKDAFYGFTNVLFNIVMAEERHDAKRIKTALEELEKESSIPNREWLLEKIDDLSKVVKVPNPK